MHCCYGTSRYLDRAERKDVFFIRFPQKNREPVKCARWAKVCCRQKFTAESVIKDTYIVDCILLEMQAQHLITQIQFLQLLQNMR